MAARGEIGPMPDCAIFADTGWEPQGVYDWLAWLETQLPFPVHRVRRHGGRDLGEHAIFVASHKVTRTASPPYFTANPDGRLPKQCSSEYKIRPIGREVRRILGPDFRPGRKPVVERWIGISSDEMQRMKRAKVMYTQNRWPLIEMRMNRADCLKWMADRQYPTPPKSSCVFCPFRGNKQWRDMRDSAPDDWRRATDFDVAIRSGFSGMVGEAFLHVSRQPLSEAPIDEISSIEGDLFAEECDGVCGV